MKQLQKAWIFISHSSKDTENVRRLRDEVEKLGGEPLLFFLKCVSEDDELDSLLKREIEARQYFLLCDSVHAKTSRWVQEEVSHVRSLEGKEFEEIDLSWPWERQASVIQKLLRTATLFFAYSHADRKIIDPLIDELPSQDFALYDSFSQVAASQDLWEAIAIAIDRSRFFLHFLSDNSLESQFCRLEAEYFRKRPENEGNYIPVILERTPAVRAALEALNVVAIDFTSRDASHFVRQLRSRLYPSTPRH